MRNRRNPWVVRAAWGAAASGLALAFALAGHAAPPVYVDTPPRFSEAATQPLRDLNIVHSKVAPSLQQARAAPYDLTDMRECAKLDAQITELDSVLGPDVDSGAQTRSHFVKSLATDALSSAIKLPMRGVVRTLSGADKRERERQDSLKAGLARRAFLKGVVAGRCHGDDAPYLQVAAAEPKVAAQPPAAPIQIAQAEPPPPPMVRHTRYVWVATGPDGRSRALTDGPSGGSAGPPAWVRERAAFSSARQDDDRASDPYGDDEYGQVEGYAPNRR